MYLQYKNLLIYIRKYKTKLKNTHYSADNKKNLEKNCLIYLLTDQTQIGKIG